MRKWDRPEGIYRGGYDKTKKIASLRCVLFYSPVVACSNPPAQVLPYAPAVDLITFCVWLFNPLSMSICETYKLFFFYYSQLT